MFVLPSLCDTFIPSRPCNFLFFIDTSEDPSRHDTMKFRVTSTCTRLQVGLGSVGVPPTTCKDREPLGRDDFVLTQTWKYWAPDLGLVGDRGREG